uniref:FCH and mu domain containing endocytic adaptor 1 n=1 Tax=Neogobius melanostomus TaxID=47308 RepID=A0A8C6UZV2_9GOBI
MKHGQLATKELAEFIRERAAIEETYSKSMSKLAKMASNGSTLGTFAPMWDVFRVSADKLALCHLELMRKMNDLIRDINKYGEEQVKIHRKTKEEMVGTVEAVQALQAQNGHLQKSKEGYHAKCIELERLKKEGAPQKEVEKAEMKSKKAAESFALCIEKYNRVGGEFEQKMSESAQKFQEIEETHLRQMKQLIKGYSHSTEDTHVQVGQVHEEFKQNVENIGIDNLIQKFAEQKGTGKDRPALVGFEEYMTALAPEGGKKSRGKTQKTHKPHPSLVLNHPSLLSRVVTLTHVPERCAEEKEHNFYSSDSDFDDEEPKKFHIQIRPVTSGNRSSAAAQDRELKATVGALTLPPNRAARQQVGLFKRRPEKDKDKDFTLRFEQTIRVCSKHKYRQETAEGVTAPSARVARAKRTSGRLCGSERVSQHFFLMISKLPKPVQTLQIYEFPSFPVSSPAPYIDGTMFFTVHLSRGPSPISLSTQEAWPVAAAITEYINAYFKGGQSNRCLVKITGDLTMSFPAGITRIFSAHPNVPVLSFRLVNISRIDHFLPNQKLLFSDPSQSDPETRDFWFNMQALQVHLQREAELNPQASYYNVALIKYQVSSQDPGRAPLLLSAECQRSGTVTRVSMDYHCCPATAPSTQLTAVQVLLPLDHSATDLQCQPPASWSVTTGTCHLSPAIYQKHAITPFSQAGFSRKKDRDTLAVQFVGSGASMSGMDLELVGSRYRMSLVKKRFATGSSCFTVVKAELSNSCP